MPPKLRLRLARVVTLVFVLVLTGTIFVFRGQIQNLAHLGYLGIFLVALIANATIFLPIPGVMVVFTVGAVFNPYGIALSAGLGAALGEVTGYLVGFGGRGLAEQIPYYEQIVDWMRRHPKLNDFLIFIMAMIPNPFFDAAGIAAGTLKVPLWRFLVACIAGSAIKMLFFALAGDTALNQIFR